MNILHLCTHDFGGAGKAAYRLHNNLKASGLSSKMLTYVRDDSHNDVISFYDYNFSYRVKEKLRFDIKRISGKTHTDPDYIFLDNNSSPIKNISKLLRKIVFKPDVIVAHWISNFITAEYLYKLSDYYKVPVIWYLLDMAPMTGGCHYAWDCQGYKGSCGKCPALYSNEFNDLSHMTWDCKFRYINQTDITIVAPTSWLASQARSAGLFKGKRIEQIMIGVNHEVFKPIPREAARAIFKLPLDAKVLFFGANSLHERRKGLAYLINASNILINKYNVNKEKILVVTAGAEHDSSSAIGSILPHKHLGNLRDDMLLASAYRAADLFVCPSIEDSGPMMINESIMCGTPVVSFEMGVSQDLVYTGETGYRAELKNSEDLAVGIKYILDLSPGQRRLISERCRTKGLALCHPDVQARSFKQLFESLIDNTLYLNTI